MFRSYMLMNSADADAVQELIMATTDHLEAKASPGNVIQVYHGISTSALSPAHSGEDRAA